MSVQGQIKRFFLIIEKVSKVGIHSSAEILMHLKEHKIDISSRTLQRDITAIRNQFGIELVFDSWKNGYYIDKESSWDIETFTNILQTAISTDSLLENLRDSKAVMDYIDYGNDVELKGIQHFDTILKCIKNTFVITFDHINYSANTSKPYVLHPYLLKEYKKRWYVIGRVDGTDNIRTFGIDRLENFKPTTTTFKREDKLNPKPYFKDIVGLTYSKGEIEEITVKTTITQAKYLISQPLHHSQKIVSELSDSFTFQYHLIPNYEFKEQIFMLSNNIEVLKPQWLREEIKNTIEKTLKKYQTFF